MRTKEKLAPCEQCDGVIGLTGRVGRPPHYCSDDCRRAARAAEERDRRARRRAEIDRLREIVRTYEALGA
jgi:hypothetical protein